MLVALNFISLFVLKFIFWSIMSHWFHRNLLKATTSVGYDDVFFGSFNFTKLAIDLKKVREKLLDLLPDSSHTVDVINAAFISYLSLMSGFFMDYEVFEKKIRYLFSYKWTHTLLGQTPLIKDDALYDIANMSINTALWHMKHASFIASKTIITMDDGKNIHTTLRKAAGIFQMVINDLLPLIEHEKSASDLDSRVLNAYYTQCIAEAQEVSLARAIQLEHSDKLISALSNETSILFDNSKNHLKELEQLVSEQWRLYLDLKKHLYLSMAYYYSGKHLLKESHCGEAIRNLRESQVFYEESLRLCKLYAKVKGPSKPVKPDGHTFFTVITSNLSLMLEKCEKENDFIYHQTVPDDPVTLEKKEIHGLASPEHFTLPELLPLWKEAFENKDLIPRRQDRKKGETQKSMFRRERDLPEVKEVIHCEESEETGHDHGCKTQ